MGGGPVIIIPARYRSSRFEGKPLASIAGHSLLYRTWHRCCEVIDVGRVVVATDDDRIEDHARAHDMRVVRTRDDHLTGTDRVAEVAAAIPADVYLNVQGDEPLVDPDDIRTVLADHERGGADVVNAMCPIEHPEDWRDPMVPKVVAAPDGTLLYMSRAAVPGTKDGTFGQGWRQVCVYAFTAAALARFAGVGTRTPLEAIEDIEILRFLEVGTRVRMVEVSSASIAVDRPVDIGKVEAALRERGDPLAV